MSVHDNRDLLIRQMAPSDAFAVRAIFETTAFIEQNSLFTYHLLASKYPGCTAVAVRGGEVVGGLVGIPLAGPVDQPTRIHVWQMAVSQSARRHGVGTHLLRHVVTLNPRCGFIEASVSTSNHRSRAMFEKFAADSYTPIEWSSLNINADFPTEAGTQDPEDRLVIGCIGSSWIYPWRSRRG